MYGIRGEIRLDEPGARHNTWRAGGPIRRLFKPCDRADLAAFMRQLPATEPLLWIGLGSNLLVRDGGFPGTAISTLGGLSEMSQRGADSIYAEAGVPCNKLARFSARAGLVGGAFFAGIPGSVGGALAMNAGAFGGETWGRVQYVETIDRSGREHKRGVDDFTVSYRQVEGPADEWFVAAGFVFEQGDGESALAEIRTLLARRNASQPAGQPSCGSVFRNPEGDHAARLIERSGLKGHGRGGARVSEKHANFIINEGSASASDIEALMGEVQQGVFENQGVKLVPEVHIVGERP